MLAKSSWAEGFRREHALARAAVRSGVPTTFVEHPQHLRAAVRDGRGLNWARHALAAPRGGGASAGQPRIVSRSVIAPGHVHRLTEPINAAMARRAIGGLPRPAACVVQLPWDWALSRRLDAPVRAYDCADDYSAVFPAHRDRVLRWYERIREEADAVVIASPALERQLGSERVHQVPNATDRELVEAAPAGTPRPRHMVYVGSLSARTDLVLLDAILGLLPRWSLDLYGPCLFARRDGRPSAELSAFLGRHAPRVRWHGPVPRSGLARVLDRSVVGIAPNVVEASIGQDAMKVYDYAARGLPMVLTHRDAGSPMPPAASLARDPRDFAEAVAAHEEASGDVADAQRRWAADHTWTARFEAWRAAVSF